MTRASGASPQSCTSPLITRNARRDLLRDAHRFGLRENERKLLEHATHRHRGGVAVFLDEGACHRSGLARWELALALGQMIGRDLVGNGHEGYYQVLCEYGLGDFGVHAKDLSDPCYVYAISTGAETKVGVSKDPKARVKQLSTASPHGLSLAFALLAEKQEAYAIEAAVHERNKRSRLCGEWFSEWSPNLIDSIVRAAIDNIPGYRSRANWAAVR